MEQHTQYWLRAQGLELERRGSNMGPVRRVIVWSHLRFRRTIVYSGWIVSSTWLADSVMAVLIFL
jgi:hypothetical protein